jgi:TolB-like protein/Flp pilus assembly protein TadD
MSTLNNLLSTLKQRKIGQTVVVYLGTAWVVLEAFGFFAQRYGWDQRLFDAFLVLLLFGLPATIFVRWFQESDSPSSGRKQLYLHSINVLLAASFVVLTWGASATSATRTIASIVKDGQSIAVLPFTNLSRDPDQEYFSDGITDDIISKLYKIASLHVTSHTSVLMYKNTTKTIPQIAEELGVAYVLEGSVQRANNKVRINARLIHANDDANVWTNSFDNELSDVFQVQSKVAQEIAEGLKITLTKSEQDRIQRIPTNSTLAYEYYQQGLFFTNQGPALANAEKSKNFFEKAIEQDSTFVTAYTGLAETYITYMDWGYAAPDDVLPQALKYAQKALSLDSMCGEAYAAVGAYHIYATHDYASAGQALEKAALLNPASDVTYFRRAILDWVLRDKEAALKDISKAVELNPLSLRSNAYRVQTYFMFRDYNGALQESERLLTIFPSDNFLLWLRGCVYTQLGDYPKAIKTFLQRTVETKETNWALGYAYGKAGETEKARKIAEYLIEKSKTHYIPPSFIGVVYLGVNDIDEAFIFFEKSVAINDYWLTTYDLQPWFDAVRSDPRYINIQKRLLRKHPA